MLGKTFVSGPMANTDMHNGGTVFGVIYYQYLKFISKNEVQITNKVVFNRGMKEWQDHKEKEIWIGYYSVDSNCKHIKCELTYLNETTILYIDLIDENTLLCNEYIMDNSGKGRIFKNMKYPVGGTIL